MDPSDIAFIKGAVAFALLALTGLGAARLRLRAKLLRGLDQHELAQLKDELTETRTVLGDRVLELEERLDFAERRLLQQSEPRQDPSRSEVCTPV